MTPSPPLGARQATVAQMMHKMNPQMLAHLGGQQGLEQMMAEMEKEEKKMKKPR